MATPLSQGQTITIQLASLTPCKSYSGFETRADKTNGGVNSVKYSQLSWKAISCPHLTIIMPTEEVTNLIMTTTYEDVSGPEDTSPGAYFSENLFGL